jgi:hypothetical protein
VETVSLSTLQMKLPGQLDGRFRGFRPTGGKVHTSAAHSWRRQCQQARGKLFCGRCVELRCMRKGEPDCLFRHCPANGLHSVSDVHYGGLPGGIQVFLAIGSPDPAPFAAYGMRIVLVKTSREERRMWRHGTAGADSTRARGWQLIATELRSIPGATPSRDPRARPDAPADRMPAAQSSLRSRRQLRTSADPWASRHKASRR